MVRGTCWSGRRGRREAYRADSGGAEAWQVSESRTQMRLRGIPTRARMTGQHSKRKAGGWLCSKGPARI